MFIWYPWVSHGMVTGIQGLGFILTCLSGPTNVNTINCVVLYIGDAEISAMHNIKIA